jgi:protein-L-isoaspartate(D-aspartate) O-methyltransferase
MQDYASQRFNMVASQVLANGVTDERILAALRAVERERFVPTAKRAIAYADAVVEIVPNRYVLDPRTFALMLEAAEIRPAEKALDVGCTTGYSTAVLARLAGSVVGLEQDVDLVRIASDLLPASGAKNTSIVQGTLSDGHRGGAPYNVIFVNGAIEASPQALLAQLAEGGRLIAVVLKEAQGHAVLYLNERGRIGQRVVFDATVPLLSGFRQPVGFVF